MVEAPSEQPPAARAEATAGQQAEAWRDGVEVDSVNGGG